MICIITSGQTEGLPIPISRVCKLRRNNQIIMRHNIQNLCLDATWSIHQGWAQGSFVEAEPEVEAERSRQTRGKAAMSLIEARQGRGRGRELEAEARQTKFEARPRRGDPRKNPPSPRCIAVPNLVALSQTV